MSYTKIPKRIQSDVIKGILSKTEIRITYHICELTYGWNRSSTTVTKNDLVKCLRIDKKSVYRHWDSPNILKYFSRNGNVWTTKIGLNDESVKKPPFASSKVSKSPLKGGKKPPATSGPKKKENNIINNINNHQSDIETESDRILAFIWLKNLTGKTDVPTGKNLERDYLIHCRSVLDCFGGDVKLSSDALSQKWTDMDVKGYTYSDFGKLCGLVVQDMALSKLRSSFSPTHSTVPDEFKIKVKNLMSDISREKIKVFDLPIPIRKVLRSVGAHHPSRRGMNQKQYDAYMSDLIPALYEISDHKKQLENVQ